MKKDTRIYSGTLKFTNVSDSHTNGLLFGLLLNLNHHIEYHFDREEYERNKTEIPTKDISLWNQYKDEECIGDRVFTFYAHSNLNYTEIFKDFFKRFTPEEEDGIWGLGVSFEYYEFYYEEREDIIGEYRPKLQALNLSLESEQDDVASDEILTNIVEEKVTELGISYGKATLATHLLVTRTFSKIDAKNIVHSVKFLTDKNCINTDTENNTFKTLLELIYNDEVTADNLLLYFKHNKINLLVIGRERIIELLKIHSDAIVRSLITTGNII